MKKSRLETPLNWYRHDPKEWYAYRPHQRLSISERGLCRELEDECWGSGCVPCSPEVIADLLVEEVQEVRNLYSQAVQRCFQASGDGMMSSPYIEAIRAEAQEFRQKQADRRRGTPGGLPDEDLGAKSLENGLTLKTISDKLGPTVRKRGAPKLTSTHRNEPGNSKTRQYTTVPSVSSSVFPVKKDVTDGPTKAFPEELIRVLASILDPPQVPQVQQGPFATWEVWAILESLRVYGQNLDHRIATVYNALTRREKGIIWLDPVSEIFEECGWIEIPEDGTHLATRDRSETSAKLRKAGLCRLPLDIAGLEKRRCILAAAPTPPPRVCVPCEDGTALHLWNTLREALTAKLDRRSFTDWIEPCAPVNYDGTTLLIRAPSASARSWIEQQLAEDFEGALAECNMSNIRIQFLS